MMIAPRLLKSRGGGARASRTRAAAADRAFAWLLRDVALPRACGARGFRDMHRGIARRNDAAIITPGRDGGSGGKIMRALIAQRIAQKLPAPRWPDSSRAANRGPRGVAARRAGRLWERAIFCTGFDVTGVGVTFSTNSATCTSRAEKSIQGRQKSARFSPHSGRLSSAPPLPMTIKMGCRLGKRP